MDSCWAASGGPICSRLHSDGDRRRGRSYADRRIQHRTGRTSVRFALLQAFNRKMGAGEFLSCEKIKFISIFIFRTNQKKWGTKIVFDLILKQIITKSLPFTICAIPNYKFLFVYYLIDATFSLRKCTRTAWVTECFTSEPRRRWLSSEATTSSWWAASKRGSREWAGTSEEGSSFQDTFTAAAKSQTLFWLAKSN